MNNYIFTKLTVKTVPSVSQICKNPEICKNATGSTQFSPVLRIFCNKKLPLEAHF